MSTEPTVSGTAAPEGSLREVLTPGLKRMLVGIGFSSVGGGLVLSLLVVYLHLVRGNFFGKQQGDVLTPVRAAYKGVLVGNMGYTPAEGATAVAEGKLDAVAFLANPELPARIRVGAALNAVDPSTFYSAGPEGYTDYPALQA